ncbi:MAG TPA: hypothetical protein VMT68_12730 [Caulobacteraceae bacterium]|nr:hypothetical protein [Caulobacteraceae bacterium]
MRSLALALAMVLALGGGVAEAGPFHHFHLNLGHRLGNGLRNLTHHHQHYHHR